MEGLLLVDKNKGSSSFKVVSKVRRALGTRAVGHVGTLDPLASGLLVFLIGRYTRLSNYLMIGKKKYRAVIEFGTATNTDDKEGEVIASSDPSQINAERIETALQAFLGKQMQVPPVYSAISVNGVRSYRLARSGEAVELASREVEIFEIAFVSYKEPLLAIDVLCSKGTYIRALARDIGAKLGVPAHLADLKRTVCSGYDLADAIAEDDLEIKDFAKNHVRAEVSAIKGIDILNISEVESFELKQGRTVPARLSECAQFKEPFLAVHKEEPVALCKIENAHLKTVRGFG